MGERRGGRGRESVRGVEGKEGGGGDGLGKWKEWMRAGHHYGGKVACAAGKEGSRYFCSFIKSKLSPSLHTVR